MSILYYGECHDAENNQHKYWAVFCDDSIVITRYGRVVDGGCKSSTYHVKNLDNAAKASEYVEGKWAEKLRGGYSPEPTPYWLTPDDMITALNAEVKNNFALSVDITKGITPERLVDAYGLFSEVVLDLNQNANLPVQYECELVNKHRFPVIHFGVSGEKQLSLGFVDHDEWTSLDESFRTDLLGKGIGYKNRLAPDGMGSLYYVTQGEFVDLQLRVLLACLYRANSESPTPEMVLSDPEHTALDCSGLVASVDDAVTHLLSWSPHYKDCLPVFKTHYLMLDQTPALKKLVEVMSSISPTCDLAW